MVQRRASVIPALLTAALLGACHRGPPSTETFVWKGPVAQGEWLRLRNTNGDFTIVEGTGDSAEVRLTITRSRQGAPEAQVKVLQTSDGVIACVLFGGESRCTPDDYKGGTAWVKGFLPFLGGRTTVSGSVVLPRGVRLDALSVNGDVSVGSVLSELIVNTTNGDITVGASRGAVRVGTTNGDVELGIDSVGGSVDVQTTNGDVTILAARGVSGTLRMQTTNGDLEFGLTGNVTTRTRRQVAALLGSGGNAIELRTTNGDISVMPRDTTP